MNTNEIARIAALVGEPARTEMLLALLDGRAFTANELAGAARITPQTASRHLAQMLDAGLLLREKQGRHCYHRLASEDVAVMLESIMQVATRGRSARPVIRTGPKDDSMRRARMCYDHIAGKLGVLIADHLLDKHAIILEGQSGQVTDQLNACLAPLNWQLNTHTSEQQVLCRPCLDWSERRYHVAGRLGKELCSHLLKLGYLKRKTGERSLTITTLGTTELRIWLGRDRWDRLAAGN